MAMKTINWKYVLNQTSGVLLRGLLGALLVWLGAFGPIQGLPITVSLLAGAIFAMVCLRVNE